jgi:DNA-binding transcriptional LysR family regulator
MDLQQLRTFVAVVNQSSFAGAARQLDMAPSAVTRAVAALEQSLGVLLLHRTTRKLALTEPGALYFEQVRALLVSLDRATEEARASTASVSGNLRLTCSVAYGQTVIVPLLPSLHAQHQDLQVELLLTDAVLDLAHDRVDLAVRLGANVAPSLVGQQLAPVRYHVVASPHYLAQNGRPRTPADLAQCDCLRFALQGFRTQWRFRVLSSANERAAVQAVDVRGWLVLSTALALHRAALDGLGPALLPDWLAGTDLARGTLVDLFPQHEASAGDFDSAVWLLYPARDYLPRRVRVVVDFLKLQLGRNRAP